MSIWWILVIVLPVVGGYLAYGRAMDRVEPEPRWVPPACVLAGAIVVLPLAAALEGALASAGAVAPPAGMLALRVLVEGALGLGAAALVGRLAGRASRLAGSQIDGALDGAIYVGLVALGFAVADSLALVLPRLPLRGSGTPWVAQRVLLEALGRVTLAAVAGVGLGLAGEGPPGARRAGWIAGGLGAQVLLQIALAQLDPARLGWRAWDVVVTVLALGWFVLVAGLRQRESRLVRRVLATEVATGLLGADELDPVLRGPARDATAERRRSVLVRLALVRLRRERGDPGGALADLEAGLRDEAGHLARAGVLLA